MKIAILFATHNRLTTTRRFVRGLVDYPECPNDVTLDHYCLEDGSTDGTLEYLQSLQSINLQVGNGLYWSRSMRVLELELKKDGTKQYDLIVFANDDTNLKKGWARQIVETIERENLNPKNEWVLSFPVSSDSLNAETIYGGFNRSSKLHPLRFQLAKPLQEGLLKVDTVNMNFCILSSAIFYQNTVIDPIFVHAHADMDFGLRMKYRGVPLFLADSYIGTGRKDNFYGPVVQGIRSIISSIRDFHSHKKWPIQVWYSYSRRHAGIMMLPIFLAPYAKIISKGIAFSVKTWLCKKRVVT